MEDENISVKTEQVADVQTKKYEGEFTYDDEIELDTRKMQDDEGRNDGQEDGQEDEQKSIQKENNEIQKIDLDTSPKQTDEDNSKYAAARRVVEKELNALRRRNEEFAKSLGYNSFEELENAQKKQTYLDQGYDDKVAEKLTQVDIKLQQLEEKESKIRIAEEKKLLQDKKFFKELEPEIDKYLETNKFLPVEVVFNFVRGQNLDKLLEQETKAATQRQLNNINGKSHIKGEVGGIDINAIQIDEEEFKIYKGLNPKATRAEYAKFIKSQRS